MKPLIDIIDTTNEPNILQTNYRGAASYTAQNNMTTKKELLSALRSSKKLFGYVQYSDDDGGYFQMVKSDFIEMIVKISDDTDFSQVNITDKAIYIN